MKKGIVNTMAHRNPCLNIARILHIVLYLALCLAWQAPLVADYTPVRSIALKALDPITGELVSAGGEASTSWPVGVSLRLKATLSEDRPERFIEFVGERGEAPNVTAVWNDSGATTSYAPKLANAYATINTTGLTNFTAIDPSEIPEHAGTISNVVKITMVGVDRIIVDEVSQEDTGPIVWVAYNRPTKLRAIPVPEDAPFPAGFPIWTLESKPTTSTLSDPADDSSTVRIIPDAEGDYTLKAACGNTSKDFGLFAVQAELLRDVAGGLVDWQTLTPTLRSLMVGQQMNLEVALPAGYTGTSYDWNPGGVHFKSWDALTSPGQLIGLSAADLSSQRVTFYWANPVAARGVTARVVLNNGYRLYVRDEFDVYGPVVTFTTALGAVNLAQDPVNQAAFIGLFPSATSPPAGITFRGNIPSPGQFGAGEWNWVQTVVPAREIVLNDALSTIQRFTLNGISVLDTNNPYAPWDPDRLWLPTSYATGSATMETRDTPMQAIVHPDYPVPPKEVRIANEEFVMTLMFRPGGASSQYVPTKYVKWKWSGTAREVVPGGWVLVPGSTAQSVTPPAATTIHPQWQGNVNTGIF